MDEDIEWWGYLHTNGTIQVKRWFGDELDLKEARESPFVRAVVNPFPASGREEAFCIASERLGGSHG